MLNQSDKKIIKDKFQKEIDKIHKKINRLRAELEDNDNIIREKQESITALQASCKELMDLIVNL